MKYKLKYLGFVTICAALMIVLAGCKEISRFKQETFSCGLNKSGIFEVVVRSIKLGDDAIMVTKDGETQMPITQSSDGLITVSDRQTIIIIDRQTKHMTVTKDQTIYHLECKSSIFKM